MKTNSKTLIRIIKGCLDVAWYVNFLLAGIALFTLLPEFVFNKYADWNTEIRIPEYEIKNSIVITTNQVKDVILRTNEATLGLKIENSPFVIVSSFFLLVIIEFLIFSIIYHLRRLFSSLNKGFSFTYQNVTSLRKAAILIALILPAQCVLYFFKVQVVNSNFSNSNQFSVQPDLNFQVLIIGAILYIVAEIFNAGLELKKENEEFV